jgi:hypothetical protein
MDLKITNQSIYLYNFEENEKRLKETDGKFIIDYQFEKAKEIYKDFYDIDYDKKILSLIVAETQMGKTGIIIKLKKFYFYFHLKLYSIYDWLYIRLLMYLSLLI